MTAVPYPEKDFFGEYSKVALYSDSTEGPQALVPVEFFTECDWVVERLRHGETVEFEIFDAEEEDNRD